MTKTYLIRVALVAALVCVVPVTAQLQAQEPTQSTVETRDDDGFDWGWLGLLGLLGLVPRRPVDEVVTR
jgi:MYXO-CTERM domain-containing protein